MFNKNSVACVTQYMYTVNAVMELSPGAAGYRVCNPPMLLTAALEASLHVRF